MLKKLLKYDLKNLYKFLTVFYILAIFFSLTTKVLSIINQTTIVTILKSISTGIMFAMIANILINNLMRIWVRFKETVYGDESYLTHTLPVEKKTLYNEKFLLSLITLTTSFIVILITLVISFYTRDTFIKLKEMINTILINTNINNIEFIIVIIGILFLEIFNVIQTGTLGIIIGHKKNNHQIILSVAFSFIIDMIEQSFMLIVLIIFGLFNSNIMKIFTTDTFNPIIIRPLLYISVILYLVIILVVRLISQKELEKGVNII